MCSKHWSARPIVRGPDELNTRTLSSRIGNPVASDGCTFISADSSRDRRARRQSGMGPSGSKNSTRERVTSPRDQAHRHQAEQKSQNSISKRDHPLSLPMLENKACDDNRQSRARERHRQPIDIVPPCFQPRITVWDKPTSTAPDGRIANSKIR